MKRIICGIISLLMVMSMLSACGPASTAETVNLDPASYETDERIITIADMPPNPFDADAVQLYKDLGFTHWILTEDHVPLVDNGTLNEGYKEAIEILTEAGFEVWVRNMQNDPEYFQIETDKKGSNYGWNYTLVPRDITDDFSEFPGVTGFYMMDEPYQYTLEDDLSTPDVDESLFPAMDQLSTLIQWKNTYYPDTFWHLNHVPSSSWDHYPQGTTYADFIQYYVDNVVAKLTSGGRSICMDNYPLKDGIVEESFLHDVLTVANATRDYNATAAADQQATCGICLQTFHNTTSTRDISSSNDITFQMYTGMASGVRLFEYFCYRSMDMGSVGMYGIIDMTGQPRIYDYVMEANQRALPFERIVCAFDWYGMTVNHGSQSGQENIFEIVEDMLIEDTGVLKKVDSRYDVIVGCFDKDGQDGYMVVNYTAPDLDQTNMVTLTFPGCTTALVYTEEGTEQVNLVDGAIRLTLNCGQAAFIIPV